MKINVPTRNYYTGEKGTEEICWSVATTGEKIRWVASRAIIFIALIIVCYAITVGVCLLPWGN